ncbi:virulence factor TspB C-terminal domain-related protein [Acinetobacter beijerinckii]|uniref:virulence factor TspB C-terminal domain-related protein n=1 Tax=Acinetobacter beijerinckii TaxID=262668 RepID=UPI002405D505|nr:virulence factor TspB C-terminal domain-related protein [Acinetobacter beijerinckii]
MANHKKFIAFLMIFSIFMMPFNANASGLGGWTITNSIIQGASTLINATKNVLINGSNVVKTSTAIIKPNAVQVAKVLRGGAAGYALSIAVEQLLGAVDWVLDAENNQIVYYEQNLEEPEYVFIVDSRDNPKNGFATAQQACNAAALSKSKAIQYASYMYYPNLTYSGERDGIHYCKGIAYNVNTDEPYPGTYEVTITRVLNPDYEQDDREKKTLPLETVGQQVIDNADSGQSSAQEATSAATADALANDSATQSNARSQLETNARTQTSEEAQAETKPKDPTAPEAGSDIAIKFPVFCGWAPTICEAAQKVITFPNTLVNWWDTSTKSITESWVWVKEQYESITESTTDFFKEEPTTNTELEFSDPTNITDTSISFSNQCPAPITLADFNYHGTQQKWQMDFLPWCDVLSTFLKPIVIAMASLTAVLIVSGVRENG